MWKYHTANCYISIEIVLGYADVGDHCRQVMNKIVQPFSLAMMFIRHQQKTPYITGFIA